MNWRILNLKSLIRKYYWQSDSNCLMKIESSQNNEEVKSRATVHFHFLFHPLSILKIVHQNGALVMLVTVWCWWLTVGDNFRMFATELTVTNILKLSPTSVTNFDVYSEWTNVQGKILPDRRITSIWKDWFWNFEWETYFWSFVFESFCNCTSFRLNEVSLQPTELDGESEFDLNKDSMH